MFNADAYHVGGLGPWSCLVIASQITWKVNWDHCAKYIMFVCFFLFGKQMAKFVQKQVCLFLSAACTSARKPVEERFFWWWPSSSWPLFCQQQPTTSSSCPLFVPAQVYALLGLNHYSLQMAQIWFFLKHKQCCSKKYINYIVLYQPTEIL